MKKNTYKKIEKAIKRGNCIKMAELCAKYNFGWEVQEELMLRAFYTKHRNK